MSLKTSNSAIAERSHCMVCIWA